MAFGNVSQAGIEPGASAVRARCPNHGATRELPKFRFLTFLKDLGDLVLLSWHSHLVAISVPLAAGPSASFGHFLALLP